ncbi:unnamed protein product [Cylindrotheca closterium]|uniref:Fungal lipase-type domain-containing protein n=1 Tax=Cylindrotheca closterium TaxID=2856 RepID=A0AAD2CH89_9STRA|nr:unnamed protein product [Cylindrotheca closterium]
MAEENPPEAPAGEEAEAPKDVELVEVEEEEIDLSRGVAKSNDWDEEDDEEDTQILLDGEDLLPDFQDHFSLPKESCMVRSRKKANGVRVYDPGFSQQVVIEETYDENNGLKIEVKKMTDVTTGHQLMNAFYAIVAALFAGFLFVFCLQILLFVVLDLSIESGATSFNKTADGEEDNSIRWSTVIGVAFALISFSHYFAEALVIAGSFIMDAYNDHPLSRTFILKGNKHGHVIIEWLFLSCFFLFPIFVGCVGLLAASDKWWYYTSLSWFILVMAFFCIFCFCVVFYEVGSCYSFVANRQDADSDFILDVLKRCVLLRQTRRMSGYVTSSGLARNVFTNTEATDHTRKSQIYKSSLEIHTPIWTRLVSCMPSFLYTNLSENPKTIHTIPDVQDYRPFLTKHTWSLERIFCRPEPSRYISIVRGPGALTKGQLRSSVICSLLSMFFICLLVAGFLVWFGLGAGPIIVFLLIVLALSWSSLRNTYTLVRLGKDLIEVREAKKTNYKKAQDKAQKEGDEENGQAAPPAAAAESEPSRRSTVTFQKTDHKAKISEAVFHITQLERHYEPTEALCWISFIVELGIFFVYPTISLFYIGDSSLGGVFVVLSIVSNIRWYMNIVTAIEETGNMDLVGGDTPAETWANKARLNQIVGSISANGAYKGWRVLMTSLGFAFILILLTTFDSGAIAAAAAPLTYLPYGEWEYPGASEDMRYPTCTLSRLKGGFADQSTMLDFAWMAGAAYVADNQTQASLDTWFENSPGVMDLQPVVDEFRSREDPKNEIAVKFKLISVPGPGAGETTAIIMIRGTVNQFDMLADAQLWSAAALMQWLRGIIPIGEIWTEIFPDLVSWMNAVASTSIEKVAFYKLTTKFAEELKANGDYAHIQVTGHSLGGGLSLITGAQAKIPAVGLSAPNARISGKSYDPPIDWHDINKYGFNIIPKHDIVPKLDDVADNWQQIGCNADLSKAAGFCHFGVRSICELMHTCGSGNRPVFCECVTAYGYEPPTSLSGDQASFDQLCPMPE